MNVFEYMGIKPNWFCPQEVCIVCVTGEEKKDCINCPKVSIVTESIGIFFNIKYLRHDCLHNACIKEAT